MARVGELLNVIILLCALNLVCQGVELPYECISELREEYELPDLPFDYGDLEPYIDLTTVRFHHLGHHASYTRKLNAALAQWKSEDPDSYIGSSVLSLLQHLEDIPEKYRRNIRNNGGGFVNHNFYWSTLAANIENVTNQASGSLLVEIEKSFGSFEQFQKEFTDNALALFGSGYVWLSHRAVQKEDNVTGNLVITMTANQDTPISEGFQPILVLDVWEHAYYLKHQFRRGNHVTDWWKVVNWSAVGTLSEWWSRKDELHDEL